MYVVITLMGLQDLEEVWYSPGVDLADGDVEPGSNVLHSLVALGDDAHAFGNGLGSDGVIAGDHDDL